MKRFFLLAGLPLFLAAAPWHYAGPADEAAFKKFGAAGKASAGNLPLEFLTKDQKSFEVKFPANDANWETKWKIEWDMETLADAVKAGIAITKNRNDEAPVL